MLVGMLLVSSERNRPLEGRILSLGAQTHKYMPKGLAKDDSKWMKKALFIGPSATVQRVSLVPRGTRWSEKG